MEWKWIFISIGIFLSIIIIVVLVFLLVPFPYNETQYFSSSGAVPITIDIIPDYLEGHGTLRDLPENSLVHLYFTDDDEDFHITIDGKSVIVGEPSANPDFKFTFPKSYISDLENGLCKTIQKIKKNKDLETERSNSFLSTLWKYKGMLKYKTCFGY